MYTAGPLARSACCWCSPPPICLKSISRSQTMRGRSASPSTSPTTAARAIFATMAVVRRGAITLAAATDGASPALAAHLRAS
ncbi:MAG: hypothetical protein U0521_02385 [Anaerolineae bacterium]